MNDFRKSIDLASRPIGGAVMVANDELFAEKENLIKPEPSVEMTSFGHKGGLYDGWETRRRREPGYDFAIVRLGAPGVIRGVVVDTAHFKGNYPDSVSVQAAAVEGYPSAKQLTAAETDWTDIVSETACRGDRKNNFPVEDGHRYTHVRLSIYPDGGVARLRVHGDAVPDPRMIANLPLDLAAQEFGGRVIGCSNGFFSSPDRVLVPGRPQFMDGWETKRRRDSGNDWLEVQLAGHGHIRQVEVDTSYNVGNAPGSCQLLARDATALVEAARDQWWELMPRTTLLPDTRHRFLVEPVGRAATHVRLDIYPDGGLARLRLYGHLTTDGRRAQALHWFNTLPSNQGREVLTVSSISPATATALLGRRPFDGYAELEAAMAELSTPDADSDRAAVHSLLLGR